MTVNVKHEITVTGSGGNLTATWRDGGDQRESFKELELSGTFEQDRGPTATGTVRIPETYWRQFVQAIAQAGPPQHQDQR